MTQTETPPQFLTVKELAELLRLKERKVYDLAASGQVPCSRATGKLLFDRAEIEDWIAGAKTGQAAPRTQRPPIFLGSHDPLLDWAIRQSGCGLASYFDGSLDGLGRFSAGEGIAAGLHIHDAASDTWNLAAVQKQARGQNAVLVRFATRTRGLVTAPGAGIADMAALAGRRFAPRQAESGTSGLFTTLAVQAGLPLGAVHLTDVARTEDDAVLAVRRGVAEATLGLESVARSYGLGFVPLIAEAFDLLIDRRAWFDPPMQRLMAFLHSPATGARAASEGGYDLTELGRVIWNDG